MTHSRSQRLIFAAILLIGFCLIVGQMGWFDREPKQPFLNVKEPTRP